MSEHRTTEGGKTLYVVECDVYDSRNVGGVFSSLEAAMAAFPAEWRQTSEEFWTNDLDGSKHATIQVFELDA